MGGYEPLRGSVEQILAQRAANGAGQAITRSHEIIERGSECFLERDDGMLDSKIRREIDCIFDCSLVITLDPLIGETTSELRGYPQYYRLK